MFVNDDVSTITHIPQIGSIVKVGGIKYKIAEIVYDWDKNNVDVKSSEYLEYIQREVKARKES